MPVRPSACVFQIPLPVCPSVCLLQTPLSVCHFIYLFVCLFIRQTVLPFIHPSVRLCLSDCPVNPSIFLLQMPCCYAKAKR